MRTTPLSCALACALAWTCLAPPAAAQAAAQQHTHADAEPVEALMEP